MEAYISPLVNAVSTTEETLTVTIPFTNPPIAQTFKLSTLRTLLRALIIASTYLLFRPQLENLFRTMTGRGQQQKLTAEEVKARLQAKEQEMKRGGAGSGKKVYAVSTGQQGGGVGASKPRKKA